MKRIFILLLILLSFSCFGQEKLQRKLFVETTGADELQETIKYFTEVVVSEFTGIIVVENRDESDCVLEISVQPVSGESSSTGSRLRISVSAADTFFNEDKFSYEYISEVYSIIGLQQEFFPDLVAKTVEAFPPRDPEVEEVVTERIVEDVEVKRILKGVALTLQAVPGTKITSKTGDIYHVGGDGYTVVELPFDTTFSFRAEHPEYFPQNETVMVERENIEYALEQTKNRRWGFDAGLRIWALGIEAAGLFYPVPNRLFLSLHLESNLISLFYFFDENPPYLIPSINIGVYLLPPDSFVRFAFSAGLFTRFVFPPGEAAYVSSVVTFGAQIPLRVELSPFKRVRFFAEYKPQLIYMSGDKNFYSRYSVLEMLFITDHLYLNLSWNLVLGARVLL